MDMKEDNIIGLGAIWSFRHLLGFFRHTPMDENEYWYVQICSLVPETSRCEMSNGEKIRMLSLRRKISEKGSEERPRDHSGALEDKTTHTVSVHPRAGPSFI